nr:AAA family ATPase [Candidatus Phytoplasma sacchari]KAB8122676.1 AAA family ATPase [Candidatus Phytoplasma sacchari]
MIKKYSNNKKIAEAILYLIKFIFFSKNILIIILISSIIITNCFFIKKKENNNSNFIILKYNTFSDFKYYNKSQLNYFYNYQYSPSVQKLKNIFPKLSNNKELLEKVIKQITEFFFESEYFNIEKKEKDNLMYRIELLDKQDLFIEFKDIIETTIFTRNQDNKHIFAFIGNRIDQQNYEKYLKNKNENFKGQEGNFWRNWHPANIKIIYKSFVSLLIPIFEQLIELENLNKKNPNENQYTQKIKQLNDQIKKYHKEFKDFQQQLDQKQVEINTLTTNIINLNKDLNIFSNQLKQTQNELKQERENLQNEKKISQTSNQKIIFLEYKEQEQKKQIDEINNQKNKLKNQKQKIRKKLKKLRDKIKKINYLKEEEKNNLLHIIKKQEDTINLLMDEIEKYQQIIKEEQLTINKITKKLNIEFQNFQKISNELKNIKNDLIIQETLFENEKKISEEEKTGLREQIKNAKEEIQKREILLEKLHTKFNDLYEERNQLIKKLDQSLKELENLHLLSDQEKEYFQTEIRRTKRELEVMTNKYEETQKENQEQGSLLKLNLELSRELLKFLRDKHKLETEEQQAKIKKEILDPQNEVQKFRITNTEEFSGFDKVIGSEKVVEELKKTLQHLTNQKMFKEKGISKIPKGVLLYGPPGTGKTFLAEAFMKESKLPCFKVTSAEFSKTYVGEAPRLIGNLFEEARRLAPSIILIDECESLFKSRISYGLNSDHGNMVTAFLSNFDGIHTVKEKPVFVIATTNYKDEIDNAILSRFSKLIKVDFWEKKDIKLFLQQINKSRPIDIRSYKYFDKLIEQILNVPLNYQLRTPRKLIEISDQATGLTLYNPNDYHITILPEDFQIVLDNLSDKEQKIDWNQHKHNKHKNEELFAINEFKSIPIKHLFQDNNFNNENNFERRYFNLLKNNNIDHNKKLFYNIDTENIKLIEIKDGQEDKKLIKKFYNDEYPFPENLLGFYFEFKDNTKKFNIQEKVISLEEVLTLAIEYGAQKIYFIWDLKKKEENINIFLKLQKEFSKKYPFLKNDLAFKNKLLFACAQEANQEEDLRRIIIDYLNNIKENIVTKIHQSFLLSENKIIEKGNKNNPYDYQNNFKYYQKIKSKVDDFVNNQIIINFDEKMQNEIILEIEKENNLKNQEKIIKTLEKFLSTINFNSNFISIEKIDEIKNKVYDEFSNNLNQNKGINLKIETIENKITEEINNLSEYVFDNNWSNIFPKNTKINLPLSEKEKLISEIKNKAKKELIYEENKLDEIIINIRKHIVNYEDNFNNILERKISENFYEYFLDKNMDYRSLQENKIEFLRKKSFIFVKNELQNDQITDEKIKKKIYFFLDQNYLNQNEKNNNGIDFYIKKHPFLSSLIFFLIFLNIKNFFNYKK